VSGFLGIYNSDGAPVIASQIKRMLNACKFRGPDGGQIWIDGSIGLAHAMLHTTEESLREKQPSSINSRAWFAGDARIDNREELIDHLRPYSKHSLHQSTDAELILHAYDRWERECTSYIIGDFSFCIWDSDRRKLFGARDPLGIKQLYFLHRGAKFLFANTIASLLAAFEDKPPLNSDLVFEYLANNCDRWGRETFYQGILQLEPGHCFEFSENFREWKYYDFHSAKPIRYKSDSDYVEHYLDIFQKVVKSRLRCHKKVGMEVSGGLDSSSIACTVHHRSKDWGINSNDVGMYSFVSSKFKFMDEREYLNAVKQQCSHWRITRLDGDNMWPLKELDIEPPLDEPPPPMAMHCGTRMGILEAAKNDGCKVLLSGYGADQVLQGDGYSDLILARQFPISRLRLEWKHYGYQRGCGYLQLFRSILLGPWLRESLPETVTSPIRRIINGSSATPQLPPWLIPEWHESERKKYIPPIEHVHSAGSPSSLLSHLTRFFRDGHWLAGLTNIDRLAATQDVEIRYPYLDVRLVEFMSCIPVPMLLRNGVTKWTLRKAMANILPPKVHARFGRAITDELIHNGWSRERTKIEKMIRHSTLCKDGVVCQATLWRAWEDYWQGECDKLRPIGPYRFLSAWLHLESWLTTMRSL